MRPLILAAIFAIAIPPVFANEADLILEVTGARSAKGTVVATLFDGEDAFLRTPTNEKRVPVSSDGSATVIFDDVAPGDYAISIFHDADADGELDTGLFGIPSEDVGFSNNARGRFGPAKWKAAQFSLGEDGGAISIRLGRAQR